MLNVTLNANLIAKNYSYKIFIIKFIIKYFSFFEWIINFPKVLNKNLDAFNFVSML